MHFWATVLSGSFMHANEMTDVRVKGFKALVPGYALNILRNKSALVIGICTTFTSLVEPDICRTYVAAMFLLCSTIF